MFFYTQIHIGFFFLVGVQKIVALILGIVHAKLILDIFGQRMNLEGKVSASHGIQEIEADGKFRAEPGIDPLSQKGTRTVKHQIHGRQLHGYIAEF